MLCGENGQFPEGLAANAAGLCAERDGTCPAEPVDAALLIDASD